MRHPTVLTFALAAALLAGASIPGAIAAQKSSLALASSSPGAATARAQAQVLELERRRAQGVADRDIESLRQLISGEYYHVEINGRVRTKTEFFQMLARDESEFRSYEIDDVDVTLLGNGRIALVTGRLVAQMQGPNRPPELRARFVRLWALEGDTWRNTLHQATEIRSTALQREASRTPPR